MGKSVRFLWALLAVFILACHPNYVSHPSDQRARTLQEPVYIDKAFSSDDKQQIKDALAVWNKTLNGYQRFYVVDENWSPVVIKEDNEEIILNQRDGFRFLKMEPGDQSPGILGWVDDLGDETVHLIPANCGAYGGDVGLKIVAMHEIGHSLGISHNGVKGSLLYPYYTNQVPDNDDCIDEITATTLSMANERFDIQHLNYCHLP